VPVERDDRGLHVIPPEYLQPHVRRDREPQDKRKREEESTETLEKEEKEQKEPEINQDSVHKKKRPHAPDTGADCAR
jgi:hypothetical protein